MKISSSDKRKILALIASGISATAVVREARAIPSVSKAVDTYLARGLKSTQAVYDLVNTSGTCATCGKPTSFKSLYAGYLRYCSNYCVGTDPSIIERKTKTCLKNNGVKFPQQSKSVRKKTRSRLQQNYGVDNPSHSKEICEKRRQTFISNYGVDNPRKSKKIKEKIRLINKERYGVEIPQRLDSIKQKVVETVRSRYGVDSVMHDPEIVQRQKDAIFDKYGYESASQNPKIRRKIIRTNMKRYGGRSSMASEDVKRKMCRNNIAKYGVPYTSQVPEIAHKIVASSSLAYDVKFGRKTYTVRGFEKFAFDYFRSMGLSSRQVVNSVHDGMPTFRYRGSHLYVPDFYILKENLVVEIKSTYTLGVKSASVFRTVRAKAKAVEDEGLRFLLLVYDYEGNLLYEHEGADLSMRVIKRELKVGPLA